MPDHPEQEIYDYGGKDFEKRDVFRREWKTPLEMATSPGSEHDNGEEIGDNTPD